MVFLGVRSFYGPDMKRSGFVLMLQNTSSQHVAVNVSALEIKILSQTLLKLAGQRNEKP